MLSSYRWILMGAFVLTVMSIMVTGTDDARAADDDVDYIVEIIGIIDGQKLVEGKRVQMRGVVTDAGGGQVDDLVYRWYCGTTLIGQTPDIMWRVKGPKLSQVKLVVEDPEGREAERIVNVTIRPYPTSHNDNPIDLCFVIGVLIPIIAVILALAFLAFHSPRPRSRGPPPYR